MEDKKKLFVALLLVSTLLGSVGQLFFKIGVDARSAATLGGFILAGVIAYGVATLMYLYILSRSHLSWAYGFVGFSYIFTTMLAFLVLGETVGFERWVGVVVIAIGTALIGLS